MSCPTQSNANLPPCVALAGLPPYKEFFIDFAGFDVDPSYVGVDGKAYGHVIVTAVPRTEGAAQPCIGNQVGTFPLTHRVVVEYRCSNDALLVQRDARHGEGAHLGHLLLAWDQDGIDYAASAHGYTEVNLMLLRQLVGSMALVGSR